jgi:thymidylate kinase
MNVRLQKSVQEVRTIRFDPFEGTTGSGKQSFAMALLNEHGDGVVISSLYTREKVSVFAKPIEKKTSQYELTKEEKEVVSGKS